MKKLLVILAMIVAMSANAQWVQISNGIYGGKVDAFAVSGNNIFAGTYMYGVFLSTDND
ncbi:MAG: hypothetical protein NTY74_11330 [Ignavibacteriae bacterium]|nr:hypothetical protein [Ignavibacteriota bacterium]